MLTSIALILLVGLVLGEVFKKLKLPSLLGMIFAGILLGANCLNIIDKSVLNISGDLRQIALVIILTRAGLSLNLDDLKKVGRPAILMCFLPACFEILATLIFAPKLLGMTTIEALLLGSVIAAVSPAVIVPRMISIMENNYGVKKSIPQMILAGASVDDVFVIVLFSSFLALAQGHDADVISFIQIPTSIILGIVVGVVVGIVLNFIFKKLHFRDSAKIVIIISVSFLMIQLQNSLENTVMISGLIAIMSMGITIKRKNDVLAKRLSDKYNRLWVCAEIILFVLVGIAVDVKYVVVCGISAVLLLLIAMIFRMIGVVACTIKSGLNVKEKVFVAVSYMPKATVQAAIGTIPLSMGLACGQKVLSVAVLSILITAPIGAFLIDGLYKRLLEKN